MSAPWQDAIAVLATLMAGAWLFRRWLRKRRAKTGCDTCAAAVHARINSSRDQTASNR